MHLNDQIVSDEIVELAQKALKEALTAKRRVRAGNGVYEDVPDHRVRVDAGELVLAYKHGRPTAKSVNMNLSGRGHEPGSVKSLEVVRSMLAGGIDLNQLVQLEAKQAEKVENDEPIDI